MTEAADKRDFMLTAAPAKKHAYTEFLYCHKGGASSYYSI